jgi:hypothetical protein
MTDKLNGEILNIADATAFVAAIDKELDELARANVERVRKGRLTQAEADYVVGLLRDVRSDLAHAFGPVELGRSIERADPAVRWRDKVRWIGAELEARERDYPERTAKGRMTEADAKIGIRVMKTLRRLYWRELFMWEPEPGPALEWLQRIRRCAPSEIAAVDAAIPDGRRLKRELVRRHMALLELEDGQAQGELAA